MEMTSGFSSWKSPKTIITLVALVLFAGVMVVGLLQQRLINNPQWTVQVMGRGRIEYTPDTTVVTLGVKVDRQQQAEQALAQLNTTMEAIFDAAGNIGISQSDISTENYSLFPEYNYVNGESVLAGYTANQSVRVKIKNVTADSTIVSQVIEEASKAGANQIQDVSFETSQLDELKEQARLKAIEDAKAKSSVMANALGVRLGKVVGWWENVITSPEYPTPYYNEGRGGGGGGSPQAPAGTQEIVTEVNISYKVR